MIVHLHDGKRKECVTAKKTFGKLICECDCHISVTCSRFQTQRKIQSNNEDHQFTSSSDTFSISSDRLRLANIKTNHIPRSSFLPLSLLFYSTLSSSRISVPRKTLLRWRTTSISTPDLARLLLLKASSTVQIDWSNIGVSSFLAVVVFFDLFSY